MLTMEERKELIVDNIDPDLLVEILDISTEDLLTAFEDKVLDQWDSKFQYLEEEGDQYGPESINA